MFNSPSFSGQMQYFGSIRQNWSEVSSGVSFDAGEVPVVDEELFVNISFHTWKFTGFGIDTGPANNAQPQAPQGQHWPYKDPSSCSVYGSGNAMNFVCKSAGTTRYANSTRGCLQTYWDASTGSYSMTPGGPGAPNLPFLPVPSFVSFASSHAICLVGAVFY